MRYLEINVSPTLYLFTSELKCKGSRIIMNFARLHTLYNLSERTLVMTFKISIISERAKRAHSLVMTFDIMCIIMYLGTSMDALFRV